MISGFRKVREVLAIKLSNYTGINKIIDHANKIPLMTSGCNDGLCLVSGVRKRDANDIK